MCVGADCVSLPGVVGDMAGYTEGGVGYDGLFGGA
jgi:hypothetical protein